MNSFSEKKRAILLFTRAPQHEARSKPLAARLTFAERVGLYASCLRHTLAQADALEVPIIIATDVPEYNFAQFAGTVELVIAQRGRAFGEKLGEALRQTFAQGYDEVVCIGSDCVELSPADLRLAFAQIAQHDIVLGAAKDGGVYLIGLRREHAEQIYSLMHACHWQTAGVQRELLATARMNGLAVGLLRPCDEIDTFADLLRARALLRCVRFLKRYTGALEKCFSSFFAQFLPRAATLQCDPLRFQKAPPSVCACH